MSAKLSVIIPAYNIEGYIGKCLDSVLAQTFQDLEIIVIDDGSTDQTPQILDQYQQKYEKIQVIHKKNEGVSIARNTGIECAKGEFFLFFDGDDFMEPYTCEELYQTALEQHVDTVIYGYHLYENGAIKESFLPTFAKDHYEGKELIRELLPKFIGISDTNVNNWIKGVPQSLFVENPALWRTMVSAKVIKENQLRFRKELRVGEDTIFISEYLSHAKNCYIKRKCYYYLVVRETSTIYVYEKRPLAKLEGKMRLLGARRELTEDVAIRTGEQIEYTWRGTVIMSAIELAFLMSDKRTGLGFFEGFEKFCSYVRTSEVKDAVRKFKLGFRPGIKMIPFLFLKCRCNFILYLATWFLHVIHYEFVRN